MLWIVEDVFDEVLGFSKRKILFFTFSLAAVDLGHITITTHTLPYMQAEHGNSGYHLTAVVPSTVSGRLLPLEIVSDFTP
ncbi:hypothetical protein QG37_03595 [Candidozyma auris]|nr:hypothetical protein QG37_03595 [[Candida] auris]